MREVNEKIKGGPRGLSRRAFLGAAASALAAPAIIPARALGRDGFIPPSERIGIGIIGMGSRGNQHIYNLLGNGNAQVLATCDVFRTKAEAAKQLAETRYAARAGSGAYKGCAALQDFREVLARPDIDGVVIAAPENWHAFISIAAMRAGKDVYCEKALSLTVAEGRAVCDTVQRTGRVFQAGTQQRSDRNFRFACELARNGYLGEVKTVQVGVPGGPQIPVLPVAPPPEDLNFDLWLGPAAVVPYRDTMCSYNWYFMTDYCAGWIQSWGVHHVDIALWGLPALHASTLEIEGTADFPLDGDGDVSYGWQTTMRSPDGVTLDFRSDAKWPTAQFVRFIGDKGWVHVTRQGIDAEPKSLLGVTLKPADEHLYVSLEHMQNFLDCIRSRAATAAQAEFCQRATAATLAADAATRLGRKVVWDWRTESFGNDVEANRFLRRAMRAPWVVG